MTNVETHSNIFDKYFNPGCDKNKLHDGGLLHTACGLLGGGALAVAAIGSLFFKTKPSVAAMVAIGGVGGVTSYYTKKSGYIGTVGLLGACGVGATMINAMYEGRISWHCELGSVLQGIAKLWSIYLNAQKVNVSPPLSA